MPTRRSAKPKPTKQAKPSSKAGKKGRGKPVKKVTFVPMPEVDEASEPSENEPTPLPTPEPEAEPAPKQSTTPPFDLENHRFAMGLTARWYVEYDVDGPKPYRSIRDMAYDLNTRGVNVKTVEQLRTYITRRENGVPVRSKTKSLPPSVRGIYRVQEGGDLGRNILTIPIKPHALQLQEN